MINNVEIKATKIFYKNKQSNAKIVCNRGGMRASKSYSIAQYLLLEKFLTGKNRQILVVRKTLPSLRLSVLKDFQGFMDMYNLRKLVREEKQFLNYYCLANNNFLHFGSLDSPEKIKSTQWHYIWMEEATEFTYDDFMILQSRLSAVPENRDRNQIFLSFNPTDEYHWIKTRLLDLLPDIDEIHSTYKDNPFLTPDYIEYIEGLQETDINFYRIYALGIWGKLDSLIYSNWEAVDEIPPNGEVIYGLDFGFNNQSALLKVYIFNDPTSIIGKKVYVEEKIYKSGLTNRELIDEMTKEGVSRSARIYADCAEPARIKEIRDAGFDEVREADKNVKDGIDFVKRFKVRVFAESINCIKELRSYSWKKDKNGRVLDEPVKFNDHLMSALRYALYTHLKNYLGNGTYLTII